MIDTLFGLEVQTEMSITLLWLMAIAVRSFLFEIKFQYTREVVRGKHEMFEIFLDCPFCNGFWTGFVGYLLVYGVDVTLLPFAILVGSTAYYLNLFTKNSK